MTEGRFAEAATSPAGKGAYVAEVETEFEEDGEGEDCEELAEEDQPEEVLEEDLCPDDCDGYEVSGASAASAAAPAGDSGQGGGRSGARPGSARSSRSGQTSDYTVPEANREAWKNLGCDTEAGRMLRRLYAGKGPGDAAAKVTYPRRQAPAQRWEPKPAPRRPCPQRTAVKVPRANMRPAVDPDDPRNWRAPIPCRKPAQAILAEMENERPEKPDMPKGRDQVAEKEDLQNRFQFCGGRALPEGAMGNVPVGELPKPAPDQRLWADWCGRDQVDTNGMTAEQRKMFEDLMQAVKRKQARIAAIDAEEAADPKPSKAKTARNKEALQLRNDIDRCLADIDTLLALTE